MRGRREVRRPRGGSGQMTVELAVVLPVAIVVAIAAVNLMLFVESCAVFDRVARDAVLTEGVSPAGEQTDAAAVAGVAANIESALGRERTCRVRVTCARLGGAGPAGTSPLLTRFRCVLEYRPWPGGLSVSGVSLGAPVVLTHELEVTVDRYRSAIVA